MYTKKMTITKVRTEETMNRYFEHHKELENGKVSNFLDSLEDIAIKKFKHWIIVPNEFPYDRIAETTHILFSRRRVEFDWNKLNEEERVELEELKKGYLAENYDVLWENLPRGKTILGHFHLILLVLKRSEM